MVNKYARVLEEQDINSRTGDIWKIDDVPNLWNKKVRIKVEADGYIFDENGYAVKVED